MELSNSWLEKYFSLDILLNSQQTTGGAFIQNIIEDAAECTERNSFGSEIPHSRAREELTHIQLEKEHFLYN